MKLLILAATLSSISGAALAEQPQSSTDPAVQALGVMVQQCSGREAQALAQGYALAAQVKVLQDHLAAEKKRADDAEAKLPKADRPKT